MLTLLFMLYLRKLNKKYSFTKKIGNWHFPGYKLPLIMLPALLIGSESFSQDKRLRFGIWRNEQYIGYIHIDQTINNQQTIYDLRSEVNHKFLVPIQIKASEKSIFDNGILTYSSISRKVNNRGLVDKLLVYSYGTYRLTDGKRSKIVDLDTLRHNLVGLYFSQPALIKQVYCDNHQAISQVDKLSEGKYKVTMPDGSYNIFYYKNGKCIKVEVNNPRYKVELRPKND